MALTKVSNSMISGSTVSVIDFGADNTGLTNSTTAIQAAYDSGASVVLFPSGTYVFANITISNPVRTVGQGAVLKLRVITPAEVATLSATIAFPLFKLASNNVSFEYCQFYGDRFNQTALHSDNIIAHRWLCAITGYDDDYSNFSISHCEFYEFVNAIVCVCGSNFQISNCTLRDSNTGSLMLGLAEPSVETLHFVDELLITNCVIERIGKRTSALDTRDYGHDLPVVTGDGMIFRGGNVTISNLIIYNIDRSAIKIEQPRKNIILNGVISVNKNISDGAYEYRTLQFSRPHVDFKGTATDPNNYITTNCIAGAVTSFGQVYGVVITNNRFIITPSADVTFTLAAVLITSDNAGSGDYNIANNFISVADNVQGMRITPGTGAPIDLMLISNNQIKVTNQTGIFINATLDFVTNIDIAMNRISGAGQSINASDAKITKAFINNNNFKNITMRGANISNRTEIIITNNVSTAAINADASDILLQGNIVKTLTGTRTVDTAKTILSSYYNSQDGGEFYVCPDGDTSPSVKGVNYMYKNDTSATTVTTFDDGFDGQRLTVLFNTANTTLQNGSALRLSSAANVTPTANSAMSFVSKNNVWYEISRSIY